MKTPTHNTTKHNNTLNTSKQTEPCINTQQQFEPILSHMSIANIAKLGIQIMYSSLLTIRLSLDMKTFEKEDFSLLYEHESYLISSAEAVQSASKQHFDDDSSDKDIGAR